MQCNVMYVCMSDTPLLLYLVLQHGKIQFQMLSGKNNEHKDQLFGSGDCQVGWGSSMRRGSGRRFVPSLESCNRPVPLQSPGTPKPQKCILKSEKWHFRPPGKMAQKVN